MGARLTSITTGSLKPLSKTLILSGVSLTVDIYETDRKGLAVHAQYLPPPPHRTLTASPSTTATNNPPEIHK